MHGQQQHDATHSNVESSGQSNSDNTSSSEPSISTETPEAMIMISTNTPSDSSCDVDVEATIPFAEAVLLEDPIGDSSPKINP
jgi:hypothetical protein